MTAIARLILLTLVLVGCGTVVEIRNDPSPAPIDQNYHTMLMSTTCGEKYSMGQAGCSLAWDADLSAQSLSVLSPLGGSVLVYSAACGVDRKDYIPQGQIITYKLSELVPPGVQYCTFSLYTYWEKPPEIQTEVPFRGQSGKFYVRIRGHDVGAAQMSWTPQQGVSKVYQGLIYSQFREADQPSRDPILLNIAPTVSVTNGFYQLWSESKKIGVKKTAYSGQQIQIQRDQIMGDGKVGSYILPGWTVSAAGEPNYLDNDMIAAVEIFGKSAPKLSGVITIFAGQVCYETENTVSLVLLSGVEKASNKTKDCFPRPATDAIMGFYTNVGRAAYAFISGEKYTWIQ